MKIVDLSHDFFPGIYPANAKLDVAIETMKSVDKDGMNVLRFSFGNHTGTHIDGPRHIIKGGALIDELPLELFYGTGVVLNIVKGYDEGISRKDVLAAKPAIKEGDIVLIRTGWDTKILSPDYRDHHPYLNDDVANLMVEKKVRMVGIDTLSVDLPQTMRQEGFKHKTLLILLQNKIPALHNVRNLEAVIGKRVTVIAFPLRFRGSDSAPARVVAMVD